MHTMHTPFPLQVHSMHTMHTTYTYTRLCGYGVCRPSIQSRYVYVADVCTYRYIYLYIASIESISAPRTHTPLHSVDPTQTDLGTLYHIPSLTYALCRPSKCTLHPSCTNSCDALSCTLEILSRDALSRYTLEIHSLSTLCT
jgi:hypothetical protein